jgi:hypothetical protein
MHLRCGEADIHPIDEGSEIQQPEERHQTGAHLAQGGERGWV